MTCRRIMQCDKGQHNLTQQDTTQRHMTEHMTAQDNATHTQDGVAQNHASEYLKDNTTHFFFFTMTIRAKCRANEHMMKLSEF